MFICEKCHDKEEYKFFHFSISYGKCEDCGKVAECFDCNCHKEKAE